MNVRVESRNSLYILEDGIFECQHIETIVEKVYYYRPSQEQIDLGTDQDIEVLEETCIECGETIESDY